MQGEVGPGPGEDWAGTWTPVALDEVLAAALPGPPRTGRPRILAVDGRSGSGKSTLAERLVRMVAKSAVVHVDDVSWHLSMFDWSEAMVAGVLGPLLDGSAVSYRPPGWQAKNRPGSIAIPSGLDLVVVEGVGSGRADLEPWRDGLIWVQSDFAETERRGLARDIELGVNGDQAASVAFWHRWMAEEIPFLRADRPWDRADVVVCGTPTSQTSDHQVLAVLRPAR